MPVKNEPSARLQEMRRALHANIDELLDIHEPRMMKYLGEAEEKKLTIAFPTVYDFTESKVGVETKIRYSQVVTDGRRAEIDDSSQGQLPGTSRQELKESQVGEPGDTVSRTLEAEPVGTETASGEAPKRGRKTKTETAS